MRVLVVHAHPVETSYSAALNTIVLDELAKAGHAVDHLSLYGEGFDAVLSREERLAYHDVPDNLTDAIRPYVERVKAADALVFVYPVWNFGLPAILKGFFDRVFVPGVAFEMRGGQLVRVLPPKKKIAVVTTYGGDRLRALLMGDPPRKVACRVFWTVFRPRRPVQYLALYDMNNNGPGKLDAFKARVARAMARF
ncbi:flavodoxin family protein [Jiella endophytica]|uniref:Flavodoxin family protein n=1 Tax=Jiella endophytica TaxID=2558362 RepID=A0A4Y8RJK3_9HYPH|nr:NAD(P)H-dependent oxidoreductase [Jiella endophytica]TFF23225.1 flavodoxin family protein [Jiella endophytica]